MNIIAIVVVMFAIGVAVGFLARHNFASHKFITFDGGNTWFKNSDIRQPVTNTELVASLRSVRIKLSSKDQMGIEVI